MCWVCVSSGTTTISASGMLLPNALYDADVAEQLCCGGSDRSPVLVVTVASVVEPFLSLQHRESITQVEIVVVL